VTTRFNQVSNWVQSEIVSVEEIKARTALMARFIDIAYCSLELNNYNSTMEIFSALNSSSIFRLQKTWEGLPGSIVAKFSKIKEKLAVESNYKNYRELLHTNPPPCVPYFGVYLTDLTFADDGNPDFLQNGKLINFEKNYLLYKVIKEIKLYQQTGYNLRTVPELQNYLLSLPVIEENETYKLSLKCEPRIVEQ